VQGRTKTLKGGGETQINNKKKMKKFFENVSKKRNV
jgi:hypothetical protein